MSKKKPRHAGGSRNGEVSAQVRLEELRKETLQGILHYFQEAASQIERRANQAATDRAGAYFPIDGAPNLEAFLELLRSHCAARLGISQAGVFGEGWIETEEGKDTAFLLKTVDRIYEAAEGRSLERFGFFLAIAGFLLAKLDMAPDLRRAKPFDRTTQNPELENLIAGYADKGKSNEEIARLLVAKHPKHCPKKPDGTAHFSKEAVRLRRKKQIN